MQEERPRQLIPERRWLLDRLSHVYLGPGMDQNQWNSVGFEISQNHEKLVQTLLKLLEKLPKCEECSLTATYCVKNGPFFCDTHAREHATAVEVPWVTEIRALGPDCDP